ncbi:MAG: hemolysin III family protein [Chloroflexi bacterium]|nr:hemolysin III family protein [Chloroflexota bacterium]
MVLPSPQRPLLRGYIHLASAVVAPFALLWLLLVADSPRAYAGAAIFGGGSWLLFATSASYHIPPWPRRAKAVVARIDQSMIFVAIAASYTPFGLQTLRHGPGIAMLGLVWALAAAGVVMKATWPSAPRWLSVGCYLGIGWSALLVAKPLAGTLPPGALALVLLAGVGYSLGALAYAFGRPNPIPRYFGHHEIFHTMVTAASVLMYIVVGTSVLPA